MGRSNVPSERQRITAARVRRAARSYRNGRTLAEIGQRMGVTRQYVHLLLRRAVQEGEMQSDYASARASAREERIALLIRETAPRSSSAQEVARKVGCSSLTVMRIAGKHGIRVPKGSSAFRAIWPQRKERILALLRAGRTRKQIARLYELKPSRIADQLGYWKRRGDVRFDPWLETFRPSYRILRLVRQGRSLEEAMRTVGISSRRKILTRLRTRLRKGTLSLSTIEEAGRAGRNGGKRKVPNHIFLRILLESNRPEIAAQRLGWDVLAVYAHAWTLRKAGLMVHYGWGPHPVRVSDDRLRRVVAASPSIRNAARRLGYCTNTVARRIKRMEQMKAYWDRVRSEQS